MKQEPLTDNNISSIDPNSVNSDSFANELFNIGFHYLVAKIKKKKAAQFYPPLLIGIVNLKIINLVQNLFLVIFVKNITISK